MGAVTPSQPALPFAGVPLAASLLFVGVDLSTDALLLAVHPSALVAHAVLPNEDSVSVRKVVLKGALIV